MKKFLYEKLQKLVYGAVAPHFAAMAEHDRQVEEELNKLLALQQDVLELREQLTSGLAEQTGQIDKKIEEWTWERYLRTEKAIEEWTWERFQRLDKEIEWWTWERYSRIRRWDENLLKFIPRPEMWRLNVHIAEHCNLNCQGCDNFSSIAREEYTDIVELERDFSRLRELSDGKIRNIHLSGGEALLHPQICDFFELTRRYFEQSNIALLSNGILLQTVPDSFWESCHKNDVSITITKYPINIDMELIDRKAKEFGVFWRYMDDEEIKTSFFVPLDPTGMQNGRMNFVNCHHANECINLRNGRIYNCCVSASVRHFNAAFEEALPDGPENSIDIYQAKSMKEILDFLSKPIPLCDFCNVDGRRYGLPWGISKKAKSEWVDMEKE